MNKKQKHVRDNRVKHKDYPLEYKLSDDKEIREFEELAQMFPESRPLRPILRMTLPTYEEYKKDPYNPYFRRFIVWE